MFHALKAFANSLLLPPAGPLLVCALGLVLIWRRRGRLGWTLLLAGLACSWFLATPLVADTLAALAEHYPPLDANARTGAQAIVILGGGGERADAPEYAGPVADLVLLERLTYGAFLARRTGLPLLVTGTPLEARVMQVTLSRNFGLATRWVEDQSRDTYANAQYSARLLHAAGVKRIILVSSSTHLWRAVHEFEDTGLEVVPAPEGALGHHPSEGTRLVPGPVSQLRSDAAIHELIGEPLRRLLRALGVRERFERVAPADRQSGPPGDTAAPSGGPPAPSADHPAPTGA